MIASKRSIGCSLSPLPKLVHQRKNGALGSQRKNGARGSHHLRRGHRVHTVHTRLHHLRRARRRPSIIRYSIHQYSGACVTSTSSPPPLAIVPMIPMTLTNDCSWHRTCDWAGQPFPSMHNGFITNENVTTTEHRLLSVLTSLQDLLFKADNKGYNFFYSVVARRFKFGHVHVSYMATTGKYIGMELACKCCCRYVCVEVNSKWGTFTELQEVRATLLSFISGCEYTRPGSDDLPQR